MTDGSRSKAPNFDEKRKHQVAYEYLVHLEEAKIWIEHHLHTELPESTSLEDYFRNGVILAKLANFFAPEVMPIKKIYDYDLINYEKRGLHYKYTDNIINFIQGMAFINFPKVFYPETTDIYDMKNMPKLVYCIHALGEMKICEYMDVPCKAWKVNANTRFDGEEEDIIKMAESLEKYGIQMPAFSKIGGILASELSEDDAALHAAIFIINEALDSNNATLLCEKMKNPSSQLYGINDEYAQEYLTSLLNERSKKRQNFEKLNKPEAEEDVYDKILTQKEIQNELNRINLKNILLKLTDASRACDGEKIITCLMSRDLNARGVIFDHKDIYESRFPSFLEKKDENYILTTEDVDSLIKISNSEADMRKRILGFIENLNQNLHILTEQMLEEMILNSKVDIGKVEKENMSSYLQYIKNLKKVKADEQNDPNVFLWFDDVKDAIKRLIPQLNLQKLINKMAMNMPNEINKSLLISELTKLEINGVANDYANDYAEILHKTISERDFVDWNGWTEHRLPKTGELFYFNHNTKDYKWFEKPPSYQSLCGYMNKDNIQAAVSDVTSSKDFEKYLEANSPSISLIQAFWRTYIIHKSYVEKPLILLLQSFFRTIKERMKIKKVEEENIKNYKEISIIAQYTLTLSVMFPFIRRMEHFKKNLQHIVALQSIIRASQAHNDYNNLVHTENPSCKAVSKFVRLLEFDANDIKEENEISALKSTVLKRIRDVNEKEAEIKEMDVKIGLLVKNRLNLQDLQSTHQARSKKKKGMYLPSVTKEKQILFEKYGMFFYILQMNPTYTSNLILNFLGNRNSKFIKETCYALFNYGTNIRDEYSLIKLFSTAMEQEVMTKIDSIQEFITGDPLVLRMVIVFWRNSKAQTWLEEMVSHCVKDVVNTKYNINTNPLDIYKQWISQLETETGQTSGYPYDVDTEQALSYTEVKNTLRVNLYQMRAVCDKFVDAITSSANKIPYGIRVIARTLYRSLKERFPAANHVDYLKVIGNLFYYRLVNPAIVSPDSFNILTSAEITPEKRKNLAAISAVLQRAASNNFSEETVGDPTLSLNDYLMSAWARFSQFFETCIDVEDVEIHFNIDEYTDQTTLKKPELPLSVAQILETHSLVKELLEEICPNDNEDPLRNIIASLGDVPSTTDLVEAKNKGDKVSDEQMNEEMLNVVITIHLIAPTVRENEEEAKKKKLFADTLKKVIDLMYFEPLDKLSKILEKDFTPEQEKSYIDLQKKRQDITKSIQDSNLEQKVVNNDEEQSKIFTLKETKEIIKNNTKLLEKYGMVSTSDDCQSLVIAMKEIRNRRQYRKNRRYDLLRLRGALENLNSKSNYLKEQLEYYNQRKKSKSSSKKQVVVKYNAYKLRVAGVILEIEGLSEDHFKNVMFEISSTDDPGIFLISSKLFGVNMESTELVFQDLLQLQYENVTVIKMFERAKVNVNLLIHTINKKFFTKK